MPAVQETVEKVRLIDVDQYKYGFETLIEFGPRPEGTVRRYRPFHIREEK